MAGHRKFVAMLAARRAAAADASAFTEELVESLKYVMAIGQRDPGAERVVRLCGALAARRVQHIPLTSRNSTGEPHARQP